MASKRLLKDIANIESAGFVVSRNEKRLDTISIFLKGPKDTLYEGGLWELTVFFPSEYPFKSPSIGFVNKMYHPNVEESSGSICLDVLNKKWSPAYSLLNIFDTFIPQLLSYPNPDDPLNSEAAKLLLSDKEAYEEKVKWYVKKYSLHGSIPDKYDESDSSDSESS